MRVRCERCPEDPKPAVGVVVIPETGGDTEALCLSCYQAEVRRYAEERKELKS